MPSLLPCGEAYALPDGLGSRRSDPGSPPGPLGVAGGLGLWQPGEASLRLARAGNLHAAAGPGGGGGSRAWGRRGRCRYEPAPSASGRGQAARCRKTMPEAANCCRLETPGQRLFLGVCPGQRNGPNLPYEEEVAGSSPAAPTGETRRPTTVFCYLGRSFRSSATVSGLLGGAGSRLPRVPLAASEGTWPPRARRHDGCDRGPEPRPSALLSGAAGPARRVSGEPGGELHPSSSIGERGRARGTAVEAARFPGLPRAAGAVGGPAVPRGEPPRMVAPSPTTGYSAARFAASRFPAGGGVMLALEKREHSAAALPARLRMLCPVLAAATPWGNPARPFAPGSGASGQSCCARCGRHPGTSREIAKG